MNKQAFNRAVQLSKIKNTVNRLYIENILHCVENNISFALDQKICDRCLNIINKANITDEEIINTIVNSVKEIPNLKGLKTQSSIKEDISWKKTLIKDGWMSPYQDYNDFLDNLPD